VNRLFLASCILALGAGAAAAAVTAATNPIAARESHMKAVGKAFYGSLNKMQKGQLPYDQATVDAAFDRIVGAASDMPKLFPASSKTGDKTRALPKIWDNLSDLDARFQKLGRDAVAAKKSVKDVASLKVAYVQLNKNCSACHDNYRSKKDDD
jgi:cytochrome c556